MSDPTLTNKLLILLGDGGDPTETFSHPCGANGSEVTFTNNTGEAVVLDCTDPLGLVAAIKRWTESQDTSMNISGRVASESFATWRAWADGGEIKNVRIAVTESAAWGGGHWELPAILGEFQMGREDKATVTFTASITGAGRRSWTAAA